MVKKIFLFVGALMWFVSLSAEEVVRLIPLAGVEQDVPVAALQKIVFTEDSIVFVRKEANSIQQSAPELPGAVYKYDYSTMLFTATEPTAVESVDVSEQSKSVKFIQDGRLYIRRDDTVYDVMGQTIRN